LFPGEFRPPQTSKRLILANVIGFVCHFFATYKMTRGLKDLAGAASGLVGGEPLRRGRIMDTAHRCPASGHNPAIAQWLEPVVARET
jgi:hypothetical protein